MKKLLYLLLLMASQGVCQNNNRPTDYITIKGHIKNPTTDTLTLIALQRRRGDTTNSPFERKVVINKNGNFQDTLNGEINFWVLIYGANGFNFWTEDDLAITFDNYDFVNTLKFEGRKAAKNNFVAQRKKILANNDQDTLYKLSPKQYDIAIKNLSTQLTALLEQGYPGIEAIAYESYKSQNERYIEDMNKGYERGHAISPGKASPLFENYKNYNGSTSSLNDYKGSYAYIDIWATWCSPCKKQIPYLMEVQERYKDANIKFISISIDSEQDFNKWKDLVREEGLSGEQLFATDKEFATGYMANAIPRFIFIDPEGKIISAYAPRPSEQRELNELFNIVKP